jgi:phosphoglycerate dehydrogenase-like enzyme
MSFDVLCLHAETDLARVGVTPPAQLTIAYRRPEDPQLHMVAREVRALVIPAAGGRLAPSLFEGGKIKLVQVVGPGADRLDEAQMKKLGIAVACVPGSSNSAVAEYAVGCAIVLTRRMPWSGAEILDANYVSFRGRLVADNLPGLEGLTVGVIGLGTVGFAVAEAFRRFGCEIVYHDPAPRDEGAAKLSAKALPLDELLKTADIVTVHVPLLPQTRSLIGARQLNLMKPGAVLIQASRGGVVNETALAAVLNSGRLGGAAVDVYSTEPPDTDNPLFALESEAARRVLFTPHMAGVTRQASAALFREAWANVERMLVRGEAPLNRVY